MKDFKRKLKVLEANKASMNFKMNLMTKKYAAREIEMERGLESAQQRLVDAAQDRFGVQAQRLARMMEKHA